MPASRVAAGVLTVILAEAELELVPESIAGHPAVRVSARDQKRNPGEILLDQNVHWQAVKPLPESARRGRPDIVQMCLLTLLESPLNKMGQLSVVVHTRNNELIRIKPDTRLPRGEARFQGLFAKVLRDGRSHDKESLVWVEGTGEPRAILDQVAKGPVVRLDETGNTATPAQLAARGRDLTVVLGAFPSGGFGQAWKNAVPDVVSIWPEPLVAWAVAAELVAGCRAAWS
ncbi:MAG: 16S rRNA methyltransferase [Candidatus Thermoplasmatota archaeon]